MHSFQNKIIKRYGYSTESHEVISKDGYVLTIHRILPRKKNPSGGASSARPPVFFQHGLFCASYVWVINTPDKALGKWPYNFVNKHVLQMKECVRYFFVWNFFCYTWLILHGKFFCFTVYKKSQVVVTHENKFGSYIPNT